MRMTNLADPAPAPAGRGRAQQNAIYRPGALGIAPTARDLGVQLFEVRPTDDSLESVFGYLVRR